TSCTQVATRSLHDALPILAARGEEVAELVGRQEEEEGDGVAEPVEDVGRPARLEVQHPPPHEDAADVDGRGEGEEEEAEVEPVALMAPLRRVVLGEDATRGAVLADGHGRRAERVGFQRWRGTAGGAAERDERAPCTRGPGAGFGRETTDDRPQTAAPPSRPTRLASKPGGAGRGCGPRNRTARSAR